MKRKLILLVVLVLTAVPSMAYAQRSRPVTAVIENLQYVNLGQTSTGIRNGKMGIDTRGLQATAVLACNGDADCAAAGLDGAQVQMQQNLQIVIDVIGAGVVNGRSRTTLIILDQSGESELVRLRFRSQIRGTAFKGTDEELQAVFVLPGLGRAGTRLNLELAGTLIPGSSSSLQWQSLAGSGTLSR
ncbi:MAG: hypothetical protein ACE5FD_11470 [Anaerolineae bacterium]